MSINDSNHFVVQFLLILGGFIFAETIVRNIIETLDKELSFLVLGIYGILILLLAFEINKRNIKDIYGILLTVIYIGMMLIGLYLIKINIFGPQILAIIIYLFPIIALVLFLIIRRIENIK